MSLVERLLKEFEQLPEEKQNQVVDFVEFLKTENQQEKEDKFRKLVQDNIIAFKELAK